MTLHEAIEKLLRQTGEPMTTQQIADELNKNNWYQKKDGSKITAYQIHGRTNNYAPLFNRNGTTVSLTGQTAIKVTKILTKPTVSGVHRGEQRKIYDERRREI